MRVHMCVYTLVKYIHVIKCDSARRSEGKGTSFPSPPPTTITIIIIMIPSRDSSISRIVLFIILYVVLVFDLEIERYSAGVGNVPKMILCEWVVDIIIHVEIYRFGII